MDKDTSFQLPVEMPQPASSLRVRHTGRLDAFAAGQVHQMDLAGPAPRVLQWAGRRPPLPPPIDRPPGAAGYGWLVAEGGLKTGGLQVEELRMDFRTPPPPPTPGPTNTPIPIFEKKNVKDNNFHARAHENREKPGQWPIASHVHFFGGRPSVGRFQGLRMVIP